MAFSLDLSGKSAMVTGGLTGIGLATAEFLAEAGAKVAVGGRRAGDPEMVEFAREALGPEPLILPLDVTDQASVDAFMAEIAARQGAPDILVNSAGISCHHPVEGHGDADWLAVIDTNLTGCFRTIRACLPAMKRARWGRIVNIASTAAHVGAATHPAYCASKAGLLGLTRAVAEEGGPHGVTCVSVSPGWIETPMLQASAEKMARKTGKTVAEVRAEMAASNPQNRLVQPEEIAGAVVYCCSDLAQGIAGEDIRVTAGALW